MPNIKAIVSDFDGTLVDYPHRLTPEVEAAVRSLADSGFIFSIATGRAYEGVIEEVCHSLHLSHLQIVRGGSEIMSTTSGEVVWGKYINPATVEKLIVLLDQKPDIFLAAESGKFIYSRVKEEKLHKEFGVLSETVKPLKDMPYDKVPKVVLPPIHESQIILPIYEELSSLFPDLHIAKTTGRLGMGLDITDAGANKHLAVLEYARLMKIEPAEILGVGDSYNDHPLLTACGVKVAMGNAPAELKEIADHVVSTQAENGMLEVIKLVLQQA